MIDTMTSFFFYDLETSGLNPRYDRIMQFAGQRTDMDLQPVGQPVNLLVRLSEDTLPSPEALLVTGLTPQQTAADGIAEHQLARQISDELFTPGTIVVGFNNIRFDDEFIRHTLWRNFYDPYEWAYADKRSRWDMLDVVRLTRALRPQGIEWPTDAAGKAVNKLELLAKANKIKQTHAHDALCDVEALIGLAQLIRDRQPRLFDYLLQLRHKAAVAQLVNLDDPQPFVYASGRYQHPEKTTVAFPIAPGAKPGSVLVYDLRINPDSLDLKKPADPERPWANLPIKELQYNRCPAVAPRSVLDKASQDRLELPLDTVQQNLDRLLAERGRSDQLIELWRQRPDFPRAADVEGQLYDSFVPDVDKPRVKTVRDLDASGLADFHPEFADERLPELLLRYKAREFPTSLSEAEQQSWQSYKLAKFQRELPGLSERLAQLAAVTDDSHKQFILEEVQLWIEANAPLPD
jgi:exodeoxyribonuclease-1